MHRAARINASNPCSEYMFLDDSACNLASLNLRKFQLANGEFDVEAYKAAVRTTITAMEIIVDNAHYPTQKIGENSFKFRPLGLGYANLGALLMSRGLPYDSEPGRAYAAALTSIMCGEAYRTQRGNRGQRDRAVRGLRRQQKAVPARDAQASGCGQPDRQGAGAARSNGRGARRLAAGDRTREEHGFRNGQVTVLAPTGTIAFLMDCDTTGVEPDIALVKYKRLVGGGMLKIVNNTVPQALKKLGYNPAEVEAIIQYIDKTRPSRARRRSRTSICRCSTARSDRRAGPVRSTTWVTSE